MPEDKQRSQPDSRWRVPYWVIGAALFVLLLAGALAFLRYSRLLAAKPAAATKDLLTPAAPVPVPPAVFSPEGEALRKAAAITRNLGDRLLLVHGSIVPAGGGFQAKFDYEKRNDQERIRVNDGVFLRRTSGPWQHDTGTTPATEVESSFLNDLVKIIQAPWESAEKPEPTQSFPKAATILFAKGNQNSTEHLFSFRQTGNDFRLERFSGPVRSGGDEVDVTLNFEYPEVSTAAAIANSPEPTVRRALPVTEKTPKPSPVRRRSKKRG